MNNISNLEPKRVFYYFEKISGIPRGSGNTDAISNYLVSFAKEHNLSYVQEKIGNVIIYKPASKGYENAETVILQGHMDMVCEKNADCSHDFLNDGINLVVDGDFLRADNTTLGGDDGIALAYALAILEDDNIQHPALEAVFTVDEEVGMDGAIMLDETNLKGTQILNIDSEEEGILWSSCAGGLRCVSKVKLSYESVNENYLAYKIRVSGLLGGHSGTEIDKGRINANCQIGEILSLLQKDFKFLLTEIGGGMKDNAIPREAYAVLLIDKIDEKNFIEKCNSIIESLKKQHSVRESGLEITLNSQSLSDKAFDEGTTNKCVMLLNMLPNGVVRMSADIDNLVETSLNIGVMRTEKEYFVLDISLRSSVSDAKEMLKEKVMYITESIGGTCESFGDYPAWEFRKESKLREIFADVYTKLTGKKMEILALHAGLECGILTGKLKDADCVSFGPDIFDIHTPNEKMSISSVERTYNLLLEVLKNLK